MRTIIDLTSKIRKQDEIMVPRLLDVSGYTYSGKSAYLDFFRASRDFTVDDNEVEFDLIRMKNGLWDLKQALISDTWSPIRSSEAIKLFRTMVANLTGKKKFSKFFSPGANLEAEFPGMQMASEKLLHSLIDFSIECDWPYYDYNFTDFEILKRKIKRKFKIIINDTLEYSRVSEEVFDCLVQEAYSSVLQNKLGSEASFIVLNNAFETTACPSMLSLFGHARSIVVDRDPRDIYLTAVSADRRNPAANAILGKNVNDFISKFKLLRINNQKSNKYVYRTHFEKLILDSESEIENIGTFLNFNFEIKNIEKLNLVASRKNTLMWKQEKSKAYLHDVNEIERRLENFLVEL